MFARRSRPFNGIIAPINFNALVFVGFGLLVIVTGLVAGWKSWVTGAELYPEFYTQIVIRDAILSILSAVAAAVLGVAHRFATRDDQSEDESEVAPVLA